MLVTSIFCFYHSVFYPMKHKSKSIASTKGRFVCWKKDRKNYNISRLLLAIIVFIKKKVLIQDQTAHLPRPGVSVVSLSYSLPGGCEFDPRLRQAFFPAYFHLSPLQKHVRKVVGGFGRKSCVSTGVRKPGNMCVTGRHDMTLAVKVALNPNTTNQPSNCSLCGPENQLTISWIRCSIRAIFSQNNNESSR